MKAPLIRSLTIVAGSAALLSASTRIAQATAPSPKAASVGVQARPRLDLAALPGGVFPGASVDQGYGTHSDVAGAGPGIVATYERTFTYPNAANPPYAFFDEELFAAADPSAGVKKFAKLARDSQKQPGLGELERVISNAYLMTVVLPVSARPEARLSPHLGDGSTEILFAAHSGCCSFEAAAAIVRVRKTVAVIFAGSEGNTNRTGPGSQLDRARLAQLLALAATRMEALA
jgi:hypothetical protein